MKIMIVLASLIMGGIAQAHAYKDCSNPLYPGYYNPDVCPRANVSVDSQSDANSVIFRDATTGAVLAVAYKDCRNPLYPGYYNPDVCPKN